MQGADVYPVGLGGETSIGQCLSRVAPHMLTDYCPRYQVREWQQPGFNNFHNPFKEQVIEEEEGKAKARAREEIEHPVI